MGNRISPQSLLKSLGSPSMPQLVDVRIEEDFTSHPHLIASSMKRDFDKVTQWAPDIDPLRPITIICHKGKKLSEGVAAQLRLMGYNATSLEGGIVSWVALNFPCITPAKLPPPDEPWVTRERPKIDRIACPWLIKRFINPAAKFYYVASAEVQAVADHFNGVPYDIDPCFFGHRGELTSFDTLLIESGLKGYAPLDALATIVRGADTNRLDLAPQASGLLAISLGLSQLYDDDLVQLNHGLQIYDALFAWLRFAKEETHNWKKA